MVNLLLEKRDRTLSQQWGLWLTKRDQDRGLKVWDCLQHGIHLVQHFQLLMPRDTGKRRERPEEDIALLNQIHGASPAAADQYLEYLVLQRRSSVCLIAWLATLLLNCIYSQKNYI